MPPPKKRARWPWLIAALLLFGVGAWLMAGDPPKPDRVDKVSIPRRMTREEARRNEERRTMPVVAPAPMPEGQKPPPQIRDPVLAALPSSVKNGAVVIEANAIRHSDLGDLMVECMFTGNREGLDHMRDAGFDPLENLDRVAVADDTLMITGDFTKSDFKRLGASMNEKDFGPRAKLMTPTRSDGGVLTQMGLWNGQVLVFGDTEQDITTVLDRLEGKRDPGDRPVLTEQDQYGEIYGVMKPKPFVSDLAETNPQLAKLIEDAASSVKLHADVSHDVGVVAEVQGIDAEKTQDLRKALGSALTLAKVQAQAKGEKDAAEVLGFARVAAPKGDSANFNLEAGIPYEFLERQLKKCVENQKKRAEERARGRYPADAGD